MKNVAVIIFSCLAMLLFCCGCETYLGYHYEEMKPEKCREAEVSRKEKARYWQYKLHGKDLKIFHSAVADARFKATENLRRRRVDRYADIPSTEKGVTRQCFSTGVLTGVVILPFCLFTDALRSFFKSVNSVFSVWQDWQLDEHRPNILYMLGYMPVTGPLNFFMEMPYMYRRTPWRVKDVPSDEIEVYETRQHYVLRETESLQKPVSECVLMLGDSKIDLTIGDSGQTEVDLRQHWGNRPLLPESAVRLTLLCGKEKAFELQLKSTQLLSGEEQYLLRLIQDEKADGNARLKALLILRREGILESQTADELLRSLLGVERFKASVKN